MDIFEFANGKNNGKSTIEQSKNKKTKSRTVSYIHYNKISPNGYNDVIYKDSPRFKDASIKQLAETIKMSGEVKEPLIVKKTDIGEYELVSGHRRRLAIIDLVEKQGLDDYAMLPCIVDNATESMTKFNLIVTNSTQGERTDADKAREVSALSKLIDEMIRNNEIVPVKARDMRKFLADQLNLSETKVAQLQHIENNLVSEAKEKFTQGEMPVSVANEMAGLDKSEQRSLIENHKKEETPIKLNEVKKVKAIKKDKELEISPYDEVCAVFDDIYDEYLSPFKTYRKYLEKDILRKGKDLAIGEFWQFHANQGQALPLVSESNTPNLAKNQYHKDFGFEFQSEKETKIKMWHDGHRVVTDKKTFMMLLLEKHEEDDGVKDTDSQLLNEQVESRNSENILEAKRPYSECANYKFRNSCEECFNKSKDCPYDRTDMPVPGQIKITDYPGVTVAEAEKTIVKETINEMKNIDASKIVDDPFVMDEAEEKRMLEELLKKHEGYIRHADKGALSTKLAKNEMIIVKALKMLKQYMDEV